MQIWTIQLAQWRKARDRGIHVFDITLKSGDLFFAPTPDLLRRYKSGKIKEAGYREEFHQIMRDRWKNEHEHWLRLLQFEEVALACYCGPGEFCHRHLIREYAEGSAKFFGIPLTYEGEIVE